MPRPTQDSRLKFIDFDYRTFTFFGLVSQLVLLSMPFIIQVLQPHLYLYSWFRLGPLSLATTRGISFDYFSSRYLDVSVPWVCFHVATLLTT